MNEIAKGLVTLGTAGIALALALSALGWLLKTLIDYYLSESKRKAVFIDAIQARIGQELETISFEFTGYVQLFATYLYHVKCKSPSKRLDKARVAIDVRINDAIRKCMIYLNDDERSYLFLIRRIVSEPFAAPNLVYYSCLEHCRELMKGEYKTLTRIFDRALLTVEAENLVLAETLSRVIFGIRCDQKTIAATRKRMQQVKLEEGEYGEGEKEASDTIVRTYLLKELDSLS